MSDYNFPCPVCCKHIVIKQDEREKGGIFRCSHCGHRIKLKPTKSIKVNPQPNK